jgi:hypothetical protein
MFIRPKGGGVNRLGGAASRGVRAARRARARAHAGCEQARPAARGRVGGLTSAGVRRAGARSAMHMRRAGRVTRRGRSKLGQRCPEGGRGRGAVGAGAVGAARQQKWGIPCKPRDSQGRGIRTSRTDPKAGAAAWDGAVGLRSGGETSTIHGTEMGMGCGGGGWGCGGGQDAPSPDLTGADSGRRITRAAAAAPRRPALTGAAAASSTGPPWPRSQQGTHKPAAPTAARRRGIGRRRRGRR